MAFTAKDVMKAASTILQDSSAVRWTNPELLGYLNDAVREIVTIKPNAASETVSIALAEGATQILPDQYTVLSRVLGNTVSKATVQVLDRREILDHMIPGWMNPAQLAFSVDAAYVIHEMTNPRMFLVAPGNDGTGAISAVVGVMPSEIPMPASPLSIDSYGAAVGLPDTFRNPIIDYVLYRAFSKDSGLPGAAQRAVAHRQMFDNSIVALSNGENGMALANYAKGPTAA